MRFDILSIFSITATVNFYIVCSILLFYFVTQYYNCLLCFIDLALLLFCVAVMGRKFSYYLLDYRFYPNSFEFARNFPYLFSIAKLPTSLKLTFPSDFSYLKILIIFASSGTTQQSSSSSCSHFYGNCGFPLFYRHFMLKSNSENSFFLLGIYAKLADAKHSHH